MQYSKSKESEPGWATLKLKQRAVKRAAWIISIATAELSLQNELPQTVLPKKELADLEAEKFSKYGYGERGRKTISRTGIHIVKTEENTGLYYCSARSLEHQAHRFTFADDGSVSYFKTPYNIDCQSLGSSTVNLAGVKEILSDRSSRPELEYIIEQIGTSEMGLISRLGASAIKAPSA